MIPGILFSTLIYLPKMVFHGGEVRVGRYFLDVFGGTSYWFTSALAVAQLLLLSVCFATKKTHVGWYVAASIVFYFFSGVYPALAGTLCHRLFPSMGWAMALPVTAAAVLLGGITTYGVMRYAPFLMD